LFEVEIDKDLFRAHIYLRKVGDGRAEPFCQLAFIIFVEFLFSRHELGKIFVYLRIINARIKSIEVPPHLFRPKMVVFHA
jgi:hypothetical protein